MATKIQIRRDTIQNWIDNNPILSDGELGFEIDTYKIKIGDGYSAWDKLPYVTDIIDYNELDNMPSINGVQLKGNLSLSDLSIQGVGNYGNDENNVHIVGNERIDGIKTFLKAPNVPTVPVDDVSKKAVNSEFVQNIHQVLQTQMDESHNILNSKIDSTKNELQTNINNLNTTLNSKIDSTKNELQNSIKSLDTELDNLALTLVPTGAMFPFAGQSAPSGYLFCNGQQVSRTKYSRLFNVIGTLYGNGDGIDTFNLPDYRNRVLQGSSDGKYKKLDAGLPNITGSYTCDNEQGLNTTGAFYSSSASGPGCKNDNACVKMNFDASRSNSIYGKSSTVQPPALTTMIIIKY